MRASNTMEVRADRADGGGFCPRPSCSIGARSRRARAQRSATTASAKRRESWPRLLGEPPDVRCRAVDFPARHHDFRIVGFLVNDLARKPDGDLGLLVQHHAGDARDTAVGLLAIVEFDNRDDIRDRADKGADDRLHHYYVTVDGALACGLEPAYVHRRALRASRKDGREPFVPARLALAHQVLVLAGAGPPFDGIEVGQDAQLGIVNRSGHVSIPRIVSRDRRVRDAESPLGRHAAQDQATRHVFPAPAHAVADIRFAQLAASGFEIVSMLSFGPSGTCVVGAMTQLANVLDHHLDAVRIAFREMAARQVARQLVIDLQASALDEFSGLATAAEAVGLELNQSGESKSVVARDEIDVLVTNARHAERALPAVIAGDVM